MSTPGFATVPPWDRTKAVVQFDVTSADEEDRRELTCLFCGTTRCEWITTWVIPGRRTTAGVHERCLQIMEKPPTPEPHDAGKPGGGR